MSRVLIVIFFFIPAMAMARIGTDQGNGGDAILINGQYYLLDLLEAGIEKNPYIDRTLKVSPEFISRLKLALPSGFPIELIGQKLEEIHQIHPMMSYVLLKTIEAYQWKTVNSTLLDIYDENTSLEIPSKNMYQLAVRKDVSIFIDRSLWSKIDEGNKTALVFHEILYALNTPSPADETFKTGISFQKSEEARALNGYLFSDLKKQGANGFNRFKNGYSSLIEFKKEDIITPRFSTGGDYVLVDPFVKFEISNDWASGMSSAGFDTAFYPGSSDKDVTAIIDSACSYAVSRKLPIKLLKNNGRGLEVHLSQFLSRQGWKSYMKSEYVAFNSYQYMQRSYENQGMCQQDLQHTALGILINMKTEFK